ncbi:MAG: InlB B-repeat-containing protein [Oscillospiraceae bacterium]|nr:InlB B-repeat-containing protein [Oscillospiraceae bacterium]
MVKLKNILSLVVITALLLLPMSTISVSAETGGNDSIIATEDSITIQSESNFDTNENINNNKVIDTNNSNNEPDVSENKTSELNNSNDKLNETNNYEDIDALDGPGDFFNRGTITYNLTGGIGGPIPNPEFALVGFDRPLSDTEPTHDPVDLNGEMADVIFIGWSLTEPSDILTADDELPQLVTYVTVILNENVTVYAVWMFDITFPLTHDITFNLNGGNVAGDTNAIVVSIIENAAIGAAVPAPVRTNHRFNGWQENGEGPILSTDYVTTLTVDQSRTFIASWRRLNTGGGGWIPISPPIPEEPEVEPGLQEAEPKLPEEIPIEEAPIEEFIPEEVPAIEELPPQEDPPIEELPEDEYPPYEPYEPAEEVPTIEPETEEEYIVTELPQIIEEPTASEEDVEATQPIVEFTLTDVGNPVAGNVRRFKIINTSSPGLQFLSGTIPAFTNGNGIFYTVRYLTNLNNSPRIMASNVPADRPFSLLPPQLMNGEIVTEIIIEFDMIPAGFRMGNTIVYRFIVLNENNIVSHWDITSGEANKVNFFISAILHNIDRFSNHGNLYDDASWAKLQSTIEYVQAIISNPNSTLEEIEEAYFLLQQAISNLTPLITLTEDESTPLALGGLLFTLFVLILVIGLIVLLLKLLKYKKRILIGSPA